MENILTVGSKPLLLPSAKKNIIPIPINEDWAIVCYVVASNDETNVVTCRKLFGKNQEIFYARKNNNKGTYKEGEFVTVYRVGEGNDPSGTDFICFPDEGSLVVEDLGEEDGVFYGAPVDVVTGVVDASRTLPLTPSDVSYYGDTPPFKAGKRYIARNFYNSYWCYMPRAGNESKIWSVTETGGSGDYTLNVGTDGAGRVTSFSAEFEENIIIAPSTFYKMRWYRTSGTAAATNRFERINQLSSDYHFRTGTSSDYKIQWSVWCDDHIHANAPFYLQIFSDSALTNLVYTYSGGEAGNTDSFYNSVFFEGPGSGKEDKLIPGTTLEDYLKPGAFFPYTTSDYVPYYIRIYDSTGRASVFDGSPQTSAAWPLWALEMGAQYANYDPATDTDGSGTYVACSGRGDYLRGLNTQADNYLMYVPNPSGGALPSPFTGKAAMYAVVSQLKNNAQRNFDGGLLYASRHVSNWRFWDAGSSSFVAYDPGLGYTLARNEISFQDVTGSTVRLDGAYPFVWYLYT